MYCDTKKTFAELRVRGERAVIDEQTDKRPVFPRQNGHTPSEKLVLPAASPFPDADSNQANVYEQHTVAMPPSYQPQTPVQPLAATYDAQSGYNGYPTHTASKPLGAAPPIVPYQATIRTTWRNDPAYKVLLVAIILIIITGIAFTVYALNVFAQTASTQSNSATTVTQKPVAPQGTVDPKPTFPAPGSSTTGNQSTPGATVAPTTTPPPTMQPTQPPANTNLTAQITNSPQQVNNGTTVQVAMQASKPGVAVQLIVTYNASPGFYGSAIRYTDNGGNATLFWRIRVQMHGNRPVTARVIAVARDQNGHIAQSQMIIVQITNNN